ncbi:MAG: glycosyltransferase family 39 protein [Flavobacteriaceae bacterium]
MIFRQPRILFLLAGLLLLLNLVQAYFTELIFDEAYYWYYSRELAWGYFDHPPMVAFLIKLGSIFSEGELGIRLVSCFMSAAGFLLLWDMVDHPKKKEYIREFFIVYFSVTLLNAYGFFTLPDTPLLFFLTLFLWLYKKFIARPGIVLALCLGLSMALLMYSKYHAVLVILFVIFSNLRLVVNKYAWIAVVSALIFYSPHLLWLYDNDFVSIRYHVYERPNRAYEFGDFTLGFFVNLIVLFGLTFPWFYRSLFKTRSKDLFTRALLFLTYGFILFFFISSFNRRIQTQWLIAICIPMLIITCRMMLSDRITMRWLLRMGIANCVILLYLRIGLAYAPLFPIHYESHGNKAWVEQLAERVGERPVVFENSYRLASMYQFYSGRPAYSLNNVTYRHNQYSIDNSEAKIQNKDVLFISKDLDRSDIEVETAPGFYLSAVFLPDFQSFNKLQCLANEKEDNDKLTERSFYLYNPYSSDIELSKLKFGVAYLNQYRKVKDTLPLRVKKLEESTNLLRSGDSLYMTFELPPTDSLIPTYFKVAVSSKKLPLGLNGNKVKLEY